MVTQIQIQTYLLFLKISILVLIVLGMKSLFMDSDHASFSRPQIIR